MNSLAVYSEFHEFCLETLIKFVKGDISDFIEAKDDPVYDPGKLVALFFLVQCDSVFI